MHLFAGDRLRNQFLPAAAAAALCLAGPALAQNRAGTVEISPFGGGAFGGRLEAGTNAVFERTVHVDPAGAWGVRVAVNASRWLGIEASASTSKADVSSGSRGSLFGSGDQKLGRLELRNYELDAVFGLGRRRVIPYIAIGAGATTFKLKTATVVTSNDTRFSTSFAAGVKVFVNPHLGLRFDGRYRASYLDDGCRRDSRSCDDRDRNDRRDDSRWFGNGEVTGGLTFAF